MLGHSWKQPGFGALGSCFETNLLGLVLVKVVTGRVLPCGSCRPVMQTKRPVYSIPNASLQWERTRCCLRRTLMCSPLDVWIVAPVVIPTCGIRPPISGSGAVSWEGVLLRRMRRRLPSSMCTPDAVRRCCLSS